MKDSDSLKAWSRELAASHTIEQKKHWYSEVANAYNRVRPRYPQLLIDRAVELTQLPARSAILEIGCGPGIATVEFAQLGFSMVCLEPSQDACQLARHNCATYPKVEIINTTFEEWELESNQFNVVLAATSLHWISPEIRYQKSAEALQKNGFLILLWNTPPHPNDEICQLLDEVYQLHAPSIPKSARYQAQNTHQANFEELGKDVINSGLFKNLVSEQLVCKTSYSIDNYLALLGTMSPYIKLERQQRTSLFADLKEVLERHCRGSLNTSYLSALQIAQMECA